MEIKVFTHRSDTMRQLQNLAGRGYLNYTSGFIEASSRKALNNKLFKLYLKFVDRYDIERTAQQRWRKKSKGEASSYFIVYLQTSRGVTFYHWFLIASDGTGLVHDLEQLDDMRVKKQRLMIGGFELVRHNENSKTAWSWRISPDVKKRLIDDGLRAITYQNIEALNQIYYNLQRVPGSRLARADAYDIDRVLKRAWAYRRDKSMKTWPYALRISFWGRFLAPRTETLTIA